MSVNLASFRRPEQHLADNATLSAEQLLARSRRAVELALRETRAHVTAGEVEALTQEIALHAIRRGVRDQTTGEMVVSSGAATFSMLAYAARSKVVRSREWRDLAETWKSRAKDGGARVQVADPQLLEDPEPDDSDPLGGELSRALAAQAQRAERNGADPEPGAIMQALAWMLEDLAGATDWTPAQVARVRLALAVALDERDPLVALTDAAPSMAATTAAVRASEGRKLLRALTPSVVAQALADALAQLAGNLGGSLDDSTDAVPRTTGSATLNASGARDRMPTPGPVTFRHAARRPGSTCQRPRRNAGQDVVAYVLAVENNATLKAQRENRVARLAEGRV